ncbi:MAG: SAM hydrolase/SAM-dependent halogenase family protein [Candidatus Limnocylindria bacterium]
MSPSPEGPSRPVVSLLTDFGVRDPSGAICEGVIVGICPQATVIHISHEVTKYAIRDGALMLWCALPFLPVGIHIAVVDPGVGTLRRPVGIRVGRGDVLVGPDNGLLRPAARRLGGIQSVHELTSEAHRLHPVSTSFHGRDIFAPAAAHLACGLPIEALGPVIDPSDVVDLVIPDAKPIPGGVASSVVYIDTFGNCKLAGLRDDLEAVVGPMRPGRAVRFQSDGAAERRLRWADTFGDVAVGEPMLYVDSYDRLTLAVNQGSAASQLGLDQDHAIRILVE